MSHHLGGQGNWPRQAVGNFAILMEQRLQENEGKGHWVHTSPGNLLGRARRRLAKVKAKGSEISRAQLELLVDAANYMMMAVDNHEPPESEWRTRPDSEDELGTD